MGRFSPFWSPVLLLTLLGFGCRAAPVWGDPPDVPIIELAGDPAQIGHDYAAKLGPDIRLLDEKYFGAYLPDRRVRLEALLMASAFRARMLPEHRAEVDALADATGIKRPEMSLFQCFLDLSDMTACSTISLSAAASPDHIARFGRNLDFPSFGVADKHSVVLIYHPNGRHAFAAIGWPGMIGVLSAMNDRGLCLANMEVSRPGGRPAVAMPYTLLYREVMERCDDVPQAIELLRNSVRQTANNLMLMDAAGRRAVAEITPESVVIRQAADGKALICTNHQRGQDADSPGRCPRYDFLHDRSAADFGRIDLADLHGMLDHVSQTDLTMQTMVFEPANRVIYLAAGKDASKLPLRRLDLRPYFNPADPAPSVR
jgi:isopenicillin-N N-acyltransferase like protein